jgi:uncharacterized protein
MATFSISTGSTVRSTTRSSAVESQAPVVVLFHGLEGSADSHYARDLMAHSRARGWHGVVAHFRGCSGEDNRLPRAYFAGDSEDIERMLRHVKSLPPDAPVYAVGVSLGGNALLKWLGEAGAAARAWSSARPPSPRRST